MQDQVPANPGETVSARKPDVKYRNMWAQVGLMIITLGLYSIYWFYQSSKEMADLVNDHRAEPGLWTVLLFIPFGCLYSYYKHGELFEQLDPNHFPRWVLWVLWLFFSPAVWILVQLQLNKSATWNRPLGSPPPQTAPPPPAPQ